LLLLVSSTYSLLAHWLPLSTVEDLGLFRSSLTAYYANNSELCNPLDNTECALPFPSFFHAQADRSTVTGWQVHLQGDAFPPLHSGRMFLLTTNNCCGNSINPTFLNDLDWFSTMGPILFYLDGMKQAHEESLQPATSTKSLQRSLYQQYKH
jgi:hypothetical protein